MPLASGARAAIGDLGMNVNSLIGTTMLATTALGAAFGTATQVVFGSDVPRSKQEIDRLDLGALAGIVGGGAMVTAGARLEQHAFKPLVVRAGLPIAAAGLVVMLAASVTAGVTLGTPLERPTR